MNIREIVLDMLLELSKSGTYCHLLMRDVLNKYNYLEQRDKAFIKKVTEGVVERKIELDYVINQFSNTKVNKLKPLIREVLRMSVYQILYMEQVPDSAICNEAVKLVEMAGFQVPRDTKILVAREEQAGPNYPYSMEKLCPVLAFYVMENEDSVLAKVVEILGHEGAGHTFAMHAQDRDAVEKFAKKVPVSRFLVNTPAALGGIGATTGLFPALTLGCGAVGGSSSSNNIGPMDLVNIRRVAWGTEEEKPEKQVDGDLVELLARKILERLG